jgi:hypothetical protein
VPGDAVSGVYLAKISTVNNAFQSYIPFIVRNDARQSDFLFQSSVTTWQAYNVWPHNLGLELPETSVFQGKSLYWNPDSATNPGSWGPLVPVGVTGAEGQARKVSFNRPYLPDNLSSYSTAGHLFIRGEYNMLRWMEHEGYDVTYTTDVDTDAATDMINGPLSPGRHKVFLSVGHDEYWSWQMRDNIEKARNRAPNDQPLNIGWFGANSVYWQIRFEDSSSGSNPARRTIVAYKHLATNVSAALRDPMFIPLSQGGSVNNYLTTNLWRQNNDASVMGTQCPLPDLPNCFKPPEDELVGVMTNINNSTGRGHFRFTGNCPPFICDGIDTTISPFANLVGYEADQLFNLYPGSRAEEKTVSASEFVGKSTSTTSNSFYYEMNGDIQTNGARVFAAGTVEWGLGLDNFGADSNVGPVIHDPYYDPRVEVTTRRILNCLKNGGAACRPLQVGL